MTPIESIADWSQKKPIWWRHALKLTLMHGTLEQDDLNDILKIAHMEHGLLEPDDIFEESSKQLDFSGYTSEQYEVSLKSLSDIKGVGLLAENQTISFPKEGLFIIYGDNGAGKSSYSSILKNTCLARGDCPQIMGNIFSNQQVPPQAKIGVSLNGEDEVISWNSSTPSIEALKSIRVFDSSSASHYVNKEDALGFKPIGLNLLAELVNTVNSVKSRIEEDLMPGNGFVKLEGLSSSSVTANFLRNLSAETAEIEIKNHCITPQGIEKIQPLKREILRYKSQTAEALRNNLRQRKSVLEPLKIFCERAIKLLDGKAVDALSTLRIKKDGAEGLSEELRKATLINLPLENVAGLNWQKLWQSTQLFIEHDVKQQHFPLIEGEYCPVCLQEVGKESESRMGMLSRYLKDQTAQDAKFAKDDYDNAIKSLNSLSLDLSPYPAAISLLNNEYDLIGNEIIDLVSKLESRREILIGVLNLPTLPLDIDCFEKLKKIIEDIDASLLAVGTDEELLEFISKKETDLTHLEDMKYFSSHYDDIVSNLKRHKIIKKLEAIQSQCGTTSISTLSSGIYRHGVVQPLVSAFDDELKSFGFERLRVKVESRNKSGVQQFKLSLADESDNVIGALGVASEGEQRCIAIASFLAEMKADSRRSAVIFDDPVNSLSHEWSGRVAQRLVLESKNRQVVVGNDSNLLIVFYVQIMPDDFVMQLHRF